MTKKWVGLFGTVVILFILSAASALTDGRIQGVVRWVIDGDTFQLETGERVRLIGIDTSEYQPWKRCQSYDLAPCAFCILHFFAAAIK